MGSLVKFREVSVGGWGLGLSLPRVGWLSVAACAIGASQLCGRLGPEHGVGVGHSSSGAARADATKTNLSACLEENWARGHQPALRGKVPLSW